MLTKRRTHSSGRVHSRISAHSVCMLQLFHCTLLYDILDLLVECVNEKTIELILDVLRTVGFSLRKDDPGRLKEFVLKTQSAANKSDSNRSEHGYALLSLSNANSNRVLSQINNTNELR